MKSYALRSGSFSVLIRLFLSIIFACALTVRSNANTLNWVPLSLPAAGGSTLLEASYWPGDIPGDRTVLISRGGQEIGTVGLSFFQTVSPLTVLYRSSSMHIPPNYTPYTIYYEADNPHTNSSTLKVAPETRQLITLAGWYFNDEPLSSIGGNGASVRIYVKYLQDAHTPPLTGGHIHAIVRNPDGTTTEVSGFTDLRYEGNSGGRIYTAYKVYELAGNNTPNPKNYTIVNAWVSSLPHITPYVPDNATVTVRPSIQPVISASWHEINGDPVSHVGANGKRLRIYIRYLQTIDTYYTTDQDLRMNLRKPDGTVQELSSFQLLGNLRETIPGGIIDTAYKDYAVDNNYSASPKEYNVSAVRSLTVPHLIFQPTNVTVAVRPCTIQPILSAGWYYPDNQPISNLDSAAHNVQVRVRFIQGEHPEIPSLQIYQDQLRGTVRLPDGTTQELSNFAFLSQENVTGVGFVCTVYKNFFLPANSTNEPQNYTITSVWFTVLPHLPPFTPQNGIVIVSAPTAVVGGSVGLEGRVSTAPPLPIMFTFHPADGTADFTRTQSADANGVFRFTGIPRNQYTVRIKPINGLATVIPLDVRTNDAAISGVTLRTGDSNDDNAVDIGDLLLLIAHYNQAAPDARYHEASDFTGDGANDIGDLLLLIGNYNQLGD